MHFLWVYPVPRLEDDTQLYVCGGYSPTQKENETLTVCSGASAVNERSILKLSNPTMNDTARLNNTFPQAPDACRSTVLAGGDSDGDGNNNNDDDDDPVCFPGSATVESTKTTCSTHVVGVRRALSRQILGDLALGLCQQVSRLGPLEFRHRSPEKLFFWTKSNKIKRK